MDSDETDCAFDHAEDEFDVELDDGTKQLLINNLGNGYTVTSLVNIIETYEIWSEK